MQETDSGVPDADKLYPADPIAVPLPADSGTDRAEQGSDAPYVRHLFFTPRYKSDIYPLSKLQFEDQQFPVPGNTHAYLTKMFGDYMRLPDSIQPHTTSVKIDDQN